LTQQGSIQTEFKKYPPSQSTKVPDTQPASWHLFYNFTFIAAFPFRYNPRVNAGKSRFVRLLQYYGCIESRQIVLHMHEFHSHIGMTPPGQKNPHYPHSIYPRNGGQKIVKRTTSGKDKEEDILNFVNCDMIQKPLSLKTAWIYVSFLTGWIRNAWNRRKFLFS